MNDCAIVIATMIVQCATFSKSLNPRNIDKTVSDIRVRIRFLFESSFWISVSGCKLTILPDIQPANRIVIISGLQDVRGVQDRDFRTRVRRDSAHFEQTGSDPDYGFIQVSGSGFSNFIVLGFDANTIIKKIFAKIYRMQCSSHQSQMFERGAVALDVSCTAEHQSTTMASHQSTVRLNSTWCQITFVSCDG